MGQDEYLPGQYLPGTVYRVVRLIGEGETGRLYEVEDTTVGKRYALKALSDPRADVRELADRAMRESQILAAVADPRVVGLYTGGVLTDGRCFFVTELLQGERLGVTLRAKGKLELSVVLSAAADLGDALASMHAAGFVHRDVKPDNVFVFTGEAEVTSAKLLLGIGVAKALDPPGPKSGLVYGTFGYASPEQLRGEPAAPSMDIWSLGCVLYESITGRLPFEVSSDWRTYVDGVLGASPAPRVSDVCPDAPADLVALLARMLRKEPSRRLSRADQVSATLRRVELRRSSRPPPVGVDLASAASTKTAGAAARAPVRLHAGGDDESDSTLTLRLRALQTAPPIVANTAGRVADTADIAPVRLQLAPPEDGEATQTLRVSGLQTLPASVADAADLTPVRLFEAPQGRGAVDLTPVRLNTTSPDATDAADLTPVRLNTASPDEADTETRRLGTLQSTLSKATEAAGLISLSPPEAVPAEEEQDATQTIRVSALHLAPPKTPDAADRTPVRLFEADQAREEDTTETLRLSAPHLAPAMAAAFTQGGATQSGAPVTQSAAPHGVADESAAEEADTTLTLHASALQPAPASRETSDDDAHALELLSKIAEAADATPHGPGVAASASEGPDEPTIRGQELVPSLGEGPDEPTVRGQQGLLANAAASKPMARLRHRTEPDPIPQRRPFATLMEPTLEGPRASLPDPAPERRPLATLVDPVPERPTAALVQPAPERPTAALVQPAPERPTAALVQPAPERRPLANLVAPAPSRRPLANLIDSMPHAPRRATYGYPALDRRLGTVVDPAPDRPSSPGAVEPPPARPTRLTYALLFFSVLIAWMTVGLVFLHFVGSRKGSHFQ